MSRMIILIAIKFYKKVLSYPQLISKPYDHNVSKKSERAWLQYTIMYVVIVEVNIFFSHGNRNTFFF